MHAFCTSKSRLDICSIAKLLESVSSTLLQKKKEKKKKRKGNKLTFRFELQCCWHDVLQHCNVMKLNLAQWSFRNLELLRH